MFPKLFNLASASSPFLINVSASKPRTPLTTLITLSMIPDGIVSCRAFLNLFSATVSFGSVAIKLAIFCITGLSGFKDCTKFPMFGSSGLKANAPASPSEINAAAGLPNPASLNALNAGNIPTPNCAKP